MHRRLAAAATLGVALLVSACTNDAPQPPPPPSGGPTMPSSDPTSASPTPPSPSVDKTTADKAAVEKAYRAQFAEFNRLEMAGGATKPTRKLLDTTSGELRHAIMTVLRSDKRHGVREVRSGRLAGVVVASGKGSTRKVTACEDYTKARWIKKDGTVLEVSQPLVNLQHSIAKRGADGRWRIDYIETTHLRTLQHAVCDGAKQ